MLFHIIQISVHGFVPFIPITVFGRVKVASEPRECIHLGLGMANFKLQFADELQLSWVVINFIFSIYRNTSQLAYSLKNNILFTASTGKVLELNFPKYL